MKRSEKTCRAILQGGLVLSIIACGIFSSLPTFAQTENQITQTMESKLDKTIFLDLRDINVVDVFKFLATQGNLNIVTSKNVQGRSTLLLRNVSIQDALDILVISNQLAYTVTNGIIYIMTEDEYALSHGKNFNDQKKISIRCLKTAKPSYVLAALQAVQSAIGKIIIDEDTGTVVMIDIPEKLMQMNNILEQVETNLKTEVVQLQFAKAEDVAAQLKPQIDGKGVGTIMADTRSNQIVLSAYPERLENAIELVRALDKQNKGVLVEVRILQLTLNPSFEFGIDWEKKFPVHNFKNLDFSSTFPIDSTVTSFGTLQIGEVDRDGFMIQLKAMKEIQSTKVLANPRLMILDREEAKINIGDRLPYVVSTTTATSGENVGISQDVRFIDVGIILSVTPTINDDGYVTMKIRPEISSKTDDVTAYVGTTNDGVTISNKIPVVNSTFVESTVIVRDGISAVLGGLIRDEQTETNQGFPYLMDIPFIGNAFKSRNESIKKTEIVIIITPHIVTGAKDVLDKPIEIKKEQSSKYLPADNGLGILKTQQLGAEKTVDPEELALSLKSEILDTEIPDTKIPEKTSKNSFSNILQRMFFLKRGK